MIILKVTKKQGFTLSLKDYLWKTMSILRIKDLLKLKSKEVIRYKSIGSCYNLRKISNSISTEVNSRIKNIWKEVKYKTLSLEAMFPKYFAFIIKKYLLGK